MIGHFVHRSDIIYIYIEIFDYQYIDIDIDMYTESGQIRILHEPVKSSHLKVGPFLIIKLSGSLLKFNISSPTCD